MKSHTLAAFILVIVVMAIAVVPVSAHEYDRNDSDHPLRYVAYLVHPIGVALEYAITRPFHRLVHKPGWSYVMGHDVDYKTKDDCGCEKDMHDHSKMAPSSSDEGFEVTTEDGMVRYTIVDGPVLFASGSNVLSDPGKAVVDRIASRIKTDYAGSEVLVEGHTDSQPIQHSGWESNWELGAARALTITQYLIQQHGFNPENVSAKTFAQYKGVASNDTAEGRQANRRAVIVVKPLQ